VSNVIFPTDPDTPLRLKPYIDFRQPGQTDPWLTPVGKRLRQVKEFVDTKLVKRQVILLGEHGEC
jgi:hypothetical protein